MEIEFRKSFAKDLLTILDNNLLTKIEEVIKEVKQAQKLSEVSNVKKLKGEANHYRIRVGNHRIGIKFDGSIISLLEFCIGKKFIDTFPRLAIEFVLLVYSE